MTHLMTEEEYAQYLEEKKELEEYRYFKKSLPTLIRRYFNNVKNYVDNDRSRRVVFSCCAKEDNNRTYCDMCPVGEIFGKCPLGYQKEYSK